MGWEEWVERWRAGAILGGAGVAVAALLAMTIWTTPWGDAALASVSMVVVCGAGVLLRARRRLAGLPLEIAPAALAHSRDGVRVYRFRAWLGRGRTVQRPLVRVRFDPSEGHPVHLPIKLPCERMCGAWTIDAPDPEGHCEGPGMLHIEIEVIEGARRWQAQRSWERGTLGRGTFAPAFTTGRGRVQFDRDRWPVVVETDPASSGR